ncbi:MAG: DUF1214 domain-containing protein [Pseudomonadota bacterium]
MDSPTHEAFDDLINTLTEAKNRWASEEWNLRNAQEVAEAHKNLAHMLEAGMVCYFAMDPMYPRMTRMFTPERKYFGDNPDAIYYDSPISREHAYVMRGKMKGAVYVSITIDAGMEDGAFSSGTLAIINDKEFDVAEDGSFELWLGGEKRDRNWLDMPEGTSRITTRHYFEDQTSAAANPEKDPEWSIERVSPAPQRPYNTPDDIAAGLRRVSKFIRSRTLDRPAFGQGGTPPPFVSFTPNEFPQPTPPGDFGWSAIDAHYCMAPYYVGEGQALVITGHWPECRMANLALWNRFLQTYDFGNANISINRAQTKLEEDGSFRIVIAHEDPGVPNWIQTQGQPFGMAFWRFMLAEGEVETPKAELVDLASLK